MKRREFGKLTLTATGLIGLSPWARTWLTERKIGICDWSIQSSSSPKSFQIAKEIGLSGVQVNLGNKQNNLHLRKKEVQSLFLQESKNAGVKISSLGIAEMNQIPYKSQPETDQWVFDAIDTAEALKVEVILLAFFSKNDLRNDKKGMDAVIEKLKEVAPYAEKKNKILGIESYLTAEEHLYILEKVGSSAIKVYYDFRNAKDAGNDIFKEMDLLGNGSICELHLKENGKLLGQGDIDWEKVFRKLDKLALDTHKWMQIEGSLPPGFDKIEGHKKNLEFVNEIL